MRERVEATIRGRNAVDWRRLRLQANEMMWYLLSVMTTVSLARRDPLPAAWPGLGDPDDRPIWATARLAGAHYVISHNTRHFPPLDRGRHTYASIEYVTTVEFVEQVLGVEIASVYGQPPPVGSLVRSRRQG